MAVDEKNWLLPVTVSLTRITDNKTVEYSTELYQTADYDGTFIWEDGNYSCDCNRYLFFQRALDEPEDEDFECSDGKYRVDWIKDEQGKILYQEQING